MERNPRQRQRRSSRAPLPCTAYSRRERTAEDGGDGAAAVILGHGGGEVDGGVVEPAFAPWLNGACYLPAPGSLDHWQPDLNSARLE